METEKTTRQRFKDYAWIVIMCIVMMIFGFAEGGFKGVFDGFVKLTFSTDHLFSDYFVQGSIGGAFFNAGLMGFIAIGMLLLSKKDQDGLTIAGVFFFIGFGLFGKTIINTPPITLGVYLYSLISKKEKFGDLLPVSFMGCCMSPAVSEVYFYADLPRWAGVILGIVLGIFLGFVLPGLAKLSSRAHNGYNLYNVGFAGGILLTGVVSVLKIFGFQVHRDLLWYTDRNIVIDLFMMFFFLYLCVYGYIYDRKEKGKGLFGRWERIQVSNGVSPTDYFKKYGLGASLVNAGLIGIMSVIFTVCSGAALNGPTIGTIISVCGFGAAGKNLRGVFYIYCGAIIGSLLNLWNISEPSIIIGALFATGLSPLAASYGIIVGIIAAMTHLSTVQFTTELHYGLNLYNNGFSCGIVALFMNGLLKSFRVPKRDFLLLKNAAYKEVREEDKLKEESRD